MGRKIELDAGWLREKYADEFMTASEIAEHTEASERTVRRRLKDHGIEVRSNGVRNKPIDKKKLQKEYVKGGQSARDIAEGENYSRNHVQNSLEYHDIPVRGRVEAIRTKHGAGCMYRTHPRGHVMVGCGDDMAYVHQLVAISEGEDPHQLFSEGAYQCHHENHIPWDNRPSNIDVIPESEHHSKHYKDMVVGPNGCIVKKDLR